MEKPVENRIGEEGVGIKDEAFARLQIFFITYDTSIIYGCMDSRLIV